ncbi:MAG TPA: type I glutamate--ammonia ligase [Thermoplasmatales archaeon]|nr:type I glutamate--ammonia ligase [Thermoplasmatales archaeon]
MKPNNVVEKIEKNNIRWIQLHFTDLMGRLRIVHIPADRFLDGSILENGVTFDGYSVGVTHIDKSDMIALPDPSTFLILPCQENEARVIATMCNTFLEPYKMDPRFILQKAVEKVKKEGYDYIGFSPEMEFYVLKENEEWKWRVEHKKGYFLPPPLDEAKNYRRTLSEALQENGYKIKYHHHEAGRYQHEIEIEEMPVKDAADFCIYFKYLAKIYAHHHNLLVTFMPKPFSYDAGSGMHAHIVFYRKGENMFLDENDEYKLSQTARYFIGGIIEHARSIAALSNPTVNSYKRLVPNYEAPIYTAWARYNRSALVRIPAKKKVDVEIRNADPAANPYLFYAAILHAGIDGIKKKIMFEPVEKNIYQMSNREIKNNNIKRLPASLIEALEELEKDDILKRGLGKEAITLLIEKKKKEWQRYMEMVTSTDYEFYFNC